MSMLLIGGTGQIGSKSVWRLAAEPGASVSGRTIDLRGRRPGP